MFCKGFILMVSMLLALSTLSSAVEAPIAINTQDVSTQSPVKKTLPNDTTVEVTVKKLPNETCALELKREEKKPDPEPIANFIATAVKAIGVASTPTLPACEETDPVAEPPGFALSSQIQKRLGALETSIEPAKTAAKNLKQQFTDQGLLANQLIACVDSEGKVLDNCKDPSKYSAQVKNLLEKLGGATEVPLPSSEGYETQIAHINDLLKKSEEHSPSEDDKDKFYAWLANAYQRSGCIAAQLRFIKDIRESVVALREPTAKLLQGFGQLKVETEKKFTLPSDRNSTVSGQLTCKNFFTSIATINPVPVTIIYEEEPRFSLTAGVLYSSLGDRKIGTKALNQGDGTFRTVVSEETTQSQLIPFGFLDVRLGTVDLKKSGNEPLNLNFNIGLGVGVNTNNGTQYVEYFFGPSISIRNIHLHAGAHRGKFAKPGGGYSVGETVPSEKFPGVPIDREDRTKFAIALSYRLPLN
jgi:hypothetical protein